VTVGAGFKVWEGVYSNFNEAPSSGPGFDGPISRERSWKFALDTIDRMQNGQALDLSLRQRYEFLPALAATFLDNQPRVQILDYGGGLGVGFVLLASALRTLTDRIDYSVVEFDETCRIGNELFAGKSGPRFRTEIPSDTRFHIVHAASVLQYIGDWQEVVGQLAACAERYLALTDVYVGKFATYTTSQNYYRSRVRHWFWNEEEFIRTVERHGYMLTVRTDCQLKVLGKEGPLPMDNFPPELRIRHGSNLLFCRSK
jgi:putative methyltransferase (TIGR04325 family)